MGLPCSNGNRPNLLTNQLTVSQVADWSTRRNVWRKIWKNNRTKCDIYKFTVGELTIL